MILVVATAIWMPPMQAQESAKSSPPAQPPVGRMAPDFALLDLKGREHVLRDMRADPSIKRKGWVVVLVWWSATGPAVAKVDPILVDLHRRYTGKGVRFFAINPFVSKGPDRRGVECMAIVKEFKRIRHIDYPVLLDGNRAVSRRYGARCVPEVAVIDRKGVLRYRGAVVTPFIKKGERQYKPFLENALKAVLAGKMVPLKETRTWGNRIPY